MSSGFIIFLPARIKIPEDYIVLVGGKSIWKTLKRAVTRHFRVSETTLVYRFLNRVLPHLLVSV